VIPENAERTVLSEHKPEKPVERPVVSNATMFATSSGARISLNVGTANSQRPNRGAPPPVPPNKPHVYIPPSPGGGTCVTASPTPSPKPVTPSKFGITISKDRFSISSDQGQGSPRVVTPGSDGRKPTGPHQVCVNLK
jgi:hypothetical protein